MGRAPGNSGQLVKARFSVLKALKAMTIRPMNASHIRTIRMALPRWTMARPKMVKPVARRKKITMTARLGNGRSNRLLMVVPAPLK